MKICFVPIFWFSIFQLSYTMIIQPSWRYYTNYSQSFASSKYSICWSFLSLVFWLWLSSFCLVLKIYKSFYIQNSSCKPRRLFTFLDRGFAPYAILIFHAALKRKYFMKSIEVHLQKDKKCSKFLNSIWRKDMVGGEDWSFSQFFYLF